MAGLSLDVLSDICDQVAAYERAFLSEASLDRYRRACAWTISEVAKAAKVGATEAVEDAFDNPTPWMRRAFTYKRALTRTGDLVSAEVSVPRTRGRGCRPTRGATGRMPDPVHGRRPLDRDGAPRTPGHAPLDPPDRCPADADAAPARP